MNQGGYHHSGLFSNLDRYVMTADVEALRRELNLTPPVAPAPSLDLGDFSAAALQILRVAPLP